MVDQVMQWLEHLMGSPWVYAALFGMSWFDSVVPLFPSEAPLILAGVYAGSTGTPNVLGVLLSAALGAWIGDHMSYAIGRSLAGKVERVPEGSRRGRALRVAQELLDRRGGSALLVARFIPWGRIATTVLMGATRYPLAKFSAYDALGTLLWALHGTLMGYIGGAAFQHEPIKGLVLGLAMALVASALVEGARWWLQRRRRAAGDGSSEDGMAAVTAGERHADSAEERRPAGSAAVVAAASTPDDER